MGQIIYNEVHLKGPIDAIKRFRAAVNPDVPLEIALLGEEYYDQIGDARCPHGDEGRHPLCRFFCPHKAELICPPDSEELKARAAWRTPYNVCYGDYVDFTPGGQWRYRAYSKDRFLVGLIQPLSKHFPELEFDVAFCDQTAWGYRPKWAEHLYEVEIRKGEWRYCDFPSETVRPWWKTARLRTADEQIEENRQRYAPPQTSAPQK